MDSFLLAINDMNGFGRINWKTRILGRRSFSPKGLWDFARTAWALRCTQQEVQKLLYQRQGSSNSFLVNGTSVQGHYLRQGRLKVCPICLAEAPVCKILWELVAVVACPEHGCLLTAECPKCRRNISPSRPRPDECRCGAKLRSRKTKRALPEVVELMWLIGTKLGLPVGRRRTRSLPGKLEKLNVNDLQHVVLYFGRHIQGLDGRASTTYPFATMQQIVESGALLLTDWPRNFHGMLAATEARSGKAGKSSSVIAIFGRLKALIDNLGNDTRDLLTPEFEKFLGERWYFKKFNMRRGRLPKVWIIDGKEYVDSRHAREILWDNELYQIVKHEPGAIIEVRAKTRREMVIRRDVFAKYVDAKRNLLSVKKLAARLGISGKRAAEIVRAGIVERCTLANKLRFRIHKYDPAVVDKILGWFGLKESLPSVDVCKEDQADWRYLCRQSRYFRANWFIHLIELVRTGRVKPVAHLKSEVGIRAAVFPRSVISLLRIRPPAANISYAAAHRLLRCSRGNVHFLLKRKFLGSVPHHRCNTWRVTTDKHLKEFASKYILLRDLAARFGVSTKTLKPALSACGVEALPHAKHNPTYFYRRTTINKIVKSGRLRQAFEEIREKRRDRDREASRRDYLRRRGQGLGHASPRAAADSVRAGVA